MPRSSLQALHKALLWELLWSVWGNSRYHWSFSTRRKLVMCHARMSYASPHLPFGVTTRSSLQALLIRPCIGLRALVKCLGGTLGVTKYLVRINKDRYHIEVQHASTGQCSVLPWVPFKHFTWGNIQITLFKSFIMCNVKCLGELLVILNIQMSLRSVILSIHVSFI